MTDRVLDISSGPARLHVENGLLKIDTGRDGQIHSVPLDELAVLVLAHRQIALTQPVLSAVAAAGGAIIVADEKHLPAGLLLPVEQHHLQAERMAQQAAASGPTKKRLWQEIVTAKIHNQGALLQQLHGNDHGLLRLARKVASGDSENVEAHASRIYWTALFQDPAFRRDRDATDQNMHLNYGYSVLRAIVARALCATGLNPSLGVHHHNRYDAFCLADDLMEPFRPYVDHAVYRLIWERGAVPPLEKEEKRHLLNALGAHYDLHGERRSLFDIAARAAISLGKVFAGHTKKLVLPDV